jgi:hypothetical protein
LLVGQIRWQHAAAHGIRFRQGEYHERQGESSVPAALMWLRRIVGKTRKQGLSWLFRRVLRELRFPRTDLGRPVSRALAAISSTLLHLVALPVLWLRLVSPLRRSLVFFYDLDVAPVTFDFVGQAVAADAARRDAGLAAMHVVVVPGRVSGFRTETSDFDATVDHESQRQRLRHIVIGSMSLLPSCRGYTICPSRGMALLYWLLFVRHVHPRGYAPWFPRVPSKRAALIPADSSPAALPQIVVPPFALAAVERWLAPRTRGRKPVVITIRDQRFRPERNSNRASWLAFAERLDTSVYAPIFVLDTSHDLQRAGERYERFPVFHVGAHDTVQRAALYQLAHLNLSIVHGPTELMWFNRHCRYAIFMPLESGPETSRAYLAEQGFTVHAQQAFSGPHQRWIWASDTLDNIEHAFHDMCRVMEESEGAPTRAASRPGAAARP